MKTIITISALLASIAIPTTAHAQYTSRCSRDYFGNVTCRGSDGSNLRMNRDYFGNLNSTYSDGYGNYSRCRTSTDYFGNVTTRCN